MYASSCSLVILALIMVGKLIRLPALFADASPHLFRFLRRRSPDTEGSTNRRVSLSFSNLVGVGVSYLVLGCGPASAIQKTHSGHSPRQNHQLQIYDASLEGYC